MKTSHPLGRFSIAALAAVLLFSAATPAAAQVPISSGACVTVTTAAVAARFSGMSLTTASAGRGIYLQTLAMGAGTIGLRVTTAAVLDADLATITPTAIMGTVGTVATVVREGTAPAGAVEGDYIGAGANTFFSASFYVPPGRIVTLLHTTANTAATASVCFSEVQ